jgi:hypothetical protein
MARTYYEVATGDLYIEATIKVKIMANVNANYDPEEIIYDNLYLGEWSELDVVSIDKEELSNIQIEIDEYE